METPKHFSKKEWATLSVFQLANLSLIRQGLRLYIKDKDDLLDLILRTKENRT